MGYREEYFKHNKPFLGKYRCVRCGHWFKKSEIDVDHIIPRHKGGPDAVWNLQAMCKHCNRSKQDSLTDTPLDLTVNVAKTAIKSVLGMNKSTTQKKRKRK